jgi:hypothetical protein
VVGALPGARPPGAASTVDGPIEEALAAAGYVSLG